MRPSPDEALRAAIAKLPVPILEAEPFAVPPALADATVAVVTTAGLMRAGDELWETQASSFRVFGGDERDLMLGHLSPNFDRTGAAADLNVVYPLDRLEELERDGTIGALAPRHLSFMGAAGMGALSTMTLDSGPAAAALLREDGVDVVLLTPV